MPPGSSGRETTFHLFTREHSTVTWLDRVGPGAIIREAPNLPARRNFPIAAAVFTVAIIGAAVYFRPWADTPSQPTSLALNESPATSSQVLAAPLPAPLPPIAAPTASTDKPVQSQDAKDIIAAYDLLNKNQIPQAQQLAAGIRKRNAKHPLLATLNTAIDTRLADQNNRNDQIVALEAANARASATALPGGADIAPSAPPTPALLGEVERPAIEKAVAQWAGAFTKLDVAALSQIRTLTTQEAENWRKNFGNMSAYRMNVRLTGNPSVIDTEAIAPVEEIAVYTSKRGGGISITQQPVRTNYRLRKIGGEWKLLVPTTPMPAQ